MSRDTGIGELLERQRLPARHGALIKQEGPGRKSQCVELVRMAKFE